MVMVGKVKPNRPVKRGMARLPLVKTKMGRREVVLELLASPAAVAVAVEEEFTLISMEGVVEFVVVVVEDRERPERRRPRRVPRTRKRGSSERKMGVKSTS